MPSLYELGAGLDVQPEYLGYDDDALMGAEYLMGAGLPMRRPAARPGSAVQRPAPRPAAQQFQPKQVSADGLYCMGFPTTAVAALATANVTSLPQQIFKIERLSIPDTIAVAFLINALNIGAKNQFVTVDPVPGEAFRSGATGAVMELGVTQPGINVTLNVTNITGGALNFNAAIFGRGVA
jgi:hypothetical protein